MRPFDDAKIILEQIQIIHIANKVCAAASKMLHVFGGSYYISSTWVNFFSASFMYITFLVRLPFTWNSAVSFWQNKATKFHLLFLKVVYLY